MQNAVYVLCARIYALLCSLLIFEWRHNHYPIIQRKKQGVRTGVFKIRHPAVAKHKVSQEVIFFESILQELGIMARHHTDDDYAVSAF